MLKILQARLQQYMSRELPDVQSGFRKAKNQRPTCQHSLDQRKARKLQKNIYFCFIDYAKAFWLCRWQQTGKFLEITCLLRNLYAGQEATVRTEHGTTDWFQIRKGVHQGYILSPCLFNLYTGYIMRNAGLEEAQAGIKIAGRNINNMIFNIIIISKL